MFFVGDVAVGDEVEPLISLFTLLFGEVCIGVNTFLSLFKRNVKAWPPAVGEFSLVGVVFFSGVELTITVGAVTLEGTWVVGVCSWRVFLVDACWNLTESGVVGCGPDVFIGATASTTGLEVTVVAILLCFLTLCLLF